MPYDEEEEPPPSKPGPARPMQAVRLTKDHNSDAPLAPNDQKVLLELNGVSSAATRAPLDLVAVIDTSGSMRGNKLENAKKALSFIIRKLTDRDRLCIVQFDDNVKRLCQLRCVTEAARAELEAIVSGLRDGGSTNIEAGLREAVTVVGGRKYTTGRAANIMLLSDGKEDSDTNARSVEPGNVPVHTFGVGYGHDSKLLGAVAEKSLGGVYNYVANSNDPAKLAEAFSRILAGLVTIIAQDLELTVTPFPGEATIENVYAGTYPKDPKDPPGSLPVTVRFGTLSSEEARSVVVELALSDRTGFRPYRATVAEVQYRFRTAQGQQVTSDPEKITIKRSRKVAATAVDGAPRPVETEVIRQQHVITIRQAVEKAENDRMDEAWNVLAAALKKLVEARKRLFDPILEELQNELMKLLALFKTKQLYTQHGRPYAIASEACHGRRRSTEKGDEAAGPYDTQRVKQYRKQVQQPHETPLPSAADEELAEEPEPEAPLRRTASVVLRLLTAVLSLLAFSIMASARTSGWASDYYGRYEPYR
ncbi:unnamed protein product [Miscanthus lutarioriparius]|uniref:VWFA domain-containing protein n=1 Tax=Miscanthus lutarioriparius TaxID=422564 RepID=A0A811RQF5_9POAL|nr:unnamed protein product [Miscanthus lutarioriparius]